MNKLDIIKQFMYLNSPKAWTYAFLNGDKSEIDRRLDIRSMIDPTLLPIYYDNWKKLSLDYISVAVDLESCHIIFYNPKFDKWIIWDGTSTTPIDEDIIITSLLCTLDEYINYHTSYLGIAVHNQRLLNQLKGRSYNNDTYGVPI